LSYATDRIIRDETLIKKDIWRFLSIVFDLELTNQLNLLPDKDLVDLCHPIEPEQVTKNRFVAIDYSMIVGNSSTVPRLLVSNDVNYLAVLSRSIRDRASL
jgi:hypothetical protein